MTDDVTAAVAGLSLAEKASLASGSDFWHTQAVERAGIPAVMLTDGPHGVRKQASDAGTVDLGGAVPATCFPTAAALASSWDRDLLREVGEALGAEARAERVAVLLGPGLNIKRSPLCGRNFEYFSEDPLLTGELAASLVHGVQSHGVGTSPKHFAVNNQETDRMRVSADLDERTLREIYLPAFERVVRTAAPWTIMCAYNRVNGIYASQHRELLTGILRHEWGFDGLVMSDWGAVDQRVPALEAGLDLEMPASGGVTDAEIVAAVQAGQLDESVLDVAVARILTLLRRTAPALADPGGYDPQAHHALARRAAAAGSVLLTNDGILPLSPDPGDTLAVVGEFARTPRYQGAGSSQITPTRLDNVLDTLRSELPDGVEVAFAPGFVIGGTDDPGADPTSGDALLTEAADLARRAGTVLLFLGLPPSAETEGLDRTHLDLPADQLRLLEAVADANSRVVVVLSNGSVVVTHGWADRVAAVLECWLGGQAGGPGAVDVLLGRVNPSGRLAETVPLRLEDCPAQLGWPGEEGHVRYGEGVFVGYRYYDTVGREVSFPFGHGLSYTEFGYDDLTVEVTADGGLRVDVSITNTGSRTGREVVQVYAHAASARVARPRRELVGFTDVTLDPGRSARIGLTVAPRELAYWSTRTQGWVLEEGTVEVAVGASSRDLRLTSRVEIPGDGTRISLTADSTLAEWFEDPTGGPLLHAALGGGDDRPVPGPLGDPEFVKIVGSMPLRKVPLMNMGLTREALDDLLGAVS